MKPIVVLGAMLAGATLASSAATAVATPDEDQVFFDALAHQGFNPDYDKQICGSIKCEPLRELLVQEGHAICTELGSGAPTLVPISVIGNLDVSPEQAAGFITASRQAYCPQAPDPYSRPR